MPERSAKFPTQVSFLGELSRLDQAALAGYRAKTKERRADCNPRARIRGVASCILHSSPCAPTRLRYDFGVAYTT